MKIKILPLLASLFMVSLVVTSCLDDDTNITYSDDASITKFSINDIKTVIIEEKDTTTFTVKGTNYPFTINQLSGSIYNNDSLPYRTDVKKVSVSMSATGTYITYKLQDRNGKDSICTWSSTDSLDFTKPMAFTVYAANGIANKTYQVKINVHQVDPDSLIWNKIENTNYPGKSISGKQKALLFENKVFVFADASPQVMVSYATNADAWSTLTSLEGLDSKADYSSVTVFNNKLFIIAGGAVYSSGNGINWQKEPVMATGLVSTFTNRLIGINNGKFIEATLSGGNLQWDETGMEAPAGFPESGYHSVTLPFVTNNSIEQTVMISSMESSMDSTTVWTTYSNQNNWISYVTNRNHYNCPKLDNIAMIHYNGALYVLGGKGKNGDEEIEAFQYFYLSRDYGLVWKPVKEKVMLPSELLGHNGPFSCVVDADDNIWIMLSGSDTVWKGKINSLGFNKD